MGHELSTDQIVEQIKMHDTFNVLYRTFFRELAALQSDAEYSIRENVAEKVAIMNKHFNDNETQMLRRVFSHNKSRYPLSINQEILVEIVDTMHEVTSIKSGPSIADMILSKAVLEATKESVTFDTRIFL